MYKYCFTIYLHAIKIFATRKGTFKTDLSRNKKARLLDVAGLSEREGRMGFFNFSNSVYPFLRIFEHNVIILKCR